MIPVLDLRGGQVVRAVRGERGRYAPIRSPLAEGSAPLPLARALLAHPACRGEAPPCLYVADLDAIVDGRPQADALRALLQALCAEHPGLRLWLDAGFDTPAAAAALRTAVTGGLPEGPAQLRPVYGSETLRDLAALDALQADPEAILSLDSRGDRPLDPSGCWQHPARWPATVVVMTLDRVGAQAGPDLVALARIRALAPGRRLIGSGGIRDEADLAAGGAAGASGWLVASALHDGRLGAPSR